MKHVNITLTGDGFTQDMGIYGYAENEREALECARVVGFTPISDDPLDVDEYDADDGPNVCGYEPDGYGVFIVRVLDRR